MFIYINFDSFTIPLGWEREEMSNLGRRLQNCLAPCPCLLISDPNKLNNLIKIYNVFS